MAYSAVEMFSPSPACGRELPRQREPRTVDLIRRFVPTSGESSTDQIIDLGCLLTFPVRGEGFKAFKPPYNCVTLKKGKGLR